MSVSVLLASVSLSSGCASAPSPAEIELQTDDVIRTIDRVMDEAVARCNGDEACIREVNQERNRLKSLALEARLNALAENWRDARERRREFERELLEILPNFPDLRDVIDLINSDISAHDSVIQLNVEGTPTRQPQGSGSLGYANAGSYTRHAGSQGAAGFRRQTYRFTGTASAAFDAQTVSGAVDFEAVLDESTAASGAFHASLRSGAGTWQSGPISAAITVHPLGANSAVIPASGPGMLRVLLEFDYSSDAWAAVLPVYQTLNVPVTRVDGRIVLSDEPFELLEFAPHIEHPASDFHRDGVLHHPTDLAAFLAGVSSQQTLADMNHDGVWDSADYVLWDAVFFYDLQKRSGE
jgi:hypothetical protein